MTVNQPEFRIIIPARYAASRLPGKLMMDLGGEPVIARVVKRCLGSRAASVVVATDHQLIFDTARSAGAQAIMTDSDLPSGTDRIAQAAHQLDFADDEILVNVQGDEPDMPIALIEQVVRALNDEADASMATACAPLQDASQLHDPAVVKVVTDRRHHALYFSRAAIPWVRQRDGTEIDPLAQQVVRRHIGIYAFRAGYLQTFAQRDICPLEGWEKLEQLRALWHGEKVYCVDAVTAPGPGIDTLQDLQRARRLSGVES